MFYGKPTDSAAQMIEKTIEKYKSTAKEIDARADALVDEVRELRQSAMEHRDAADALSAQLELIAREEKAA